MYLRFCGVVARILYVLLITLGLVLIGSVALLVAGRYVPFVPRWLWPLEVSNWALIWMVFIGASLGLREDKHFRVDLFLSGVPFPGFRIVLKAIYYLIVGLVTTTFVYHGYRFVVRWAVIQTSEILMINLAYLYISVPLAGLLWLLFLIEAFVKEFEKEAA